MPARCRRACIPRSTRRSSSSGRGRDSTPPRRRGGGGREIVIPPCREASRRSAGIYAIRVRQGVWQPQRAMRLWTLFPELVKVPPTTSEGTAIGSTA